MAKMPKITVDCYSFLDAFASCGITDYTDGKYNGDESVSYHEAQKLQAEFLLDQIDCKKGSKILDIGCGNGRILAAAKARGAEVLGITISPEQVRKNNKNGLKSVLMNYRDIPQDWNGRFDGIVANGSIEHFVQVEEAVIDLQDRVYSEMFQIVSRILKYDGKFVTTVIHQHFPFDIKIAHLGPRFFKRGSPYFHCARLVADAGGWYPKEKQLIDCASPFFKNINREDGTDDYRRTSEEWVRLWKTVMRSNIRFWLIFFSNFIRHPRITLGLVDTLIISQSWTRQFQDWKGFGPPTRLYRDTWQKIS